MVVMSLYPILNSDMDVYICLDNEYALFCGKIYDCPVGFMERHVVEICPMDKRSICIYVSEN